jgi:hypothetical protein
MRVMRFVFTLLVLLFINLSGKLIKQINNKSKKKKKKSELLNLWADK